MTPTPRAAALLGALAVAALFVPLPLAGLAAVALVAAAVSYTHLTLPTILLV